MVQKKVIKKRRKRRTKRPRKRSLVELYLEACLKNNYPELKVKCNDRSAIRPLELDFYFPELELAIEIDGPCHRKQIFGERAFKKTQANDKRKNTRCANKGIDLRRVLYDEKTNFNHEVGRKYLKKIEEILLEFNSDI